MSTGIFFVLHTNFIHFTTVIFNSVCVQKITAMHKCIAYAGSY